MSVVDGLLGVQLLACKEKKRQNRGDGPAQRGQRRCRGRASETWARGGCDSQAGHQIPSPSFFSPSAPSSFSSSQPASVPAAQASSNSFSAWTRRAVMSLRGFVRDRKESR